MTTWRMDLTKLHFLKMGAVTHRHGQCLTRVLDQHLYEKPKVAPGHGELSRDERADGDKSCSQSVGDEGRLYTGGFLGDGQSPGQAEIPTPSVWIRRTVERWVHEIRIRPNRCGDGLRLVLEMRPTAIEDLETSHVSTDQALREIWVKATGIYRARYGWENLDSDLAWICGAKCGRKITSLLIFLFPTNRIGASLISNNEGDEEAFRTEIVAMVNIAAEVFWREHLGLGYQTPGYKSSFSPHPGGGEPSLPTLADFQKRKREPKEPRCRVMPKLSLILVPRSKWQDTLLEVGGCSPIGDPKPKGWRCLASLTHTTHALEKVKVWAILPLLQSSPQKAIIELETNFPDETAALTRVIEVLGRASRQREQLLGKKLSEKGALWGWSLSYLVAGTNENFDDKVTWENGWKYTVQNEAAFKKILPERYGDVWRTMVNQKKSSTAAKVHAHRYRNARRMLVVKLGPDSQIVTLLTHLIRGAGRVGDTLDARIDEIASTIKPVAGGFERKVEPREWLVENGKLVRRKNEGPPWSQHFDALALVEERMNGDALQSDSQNADDQNRRKMIENGSGGEKILDRLIRVMRPRHELRVEMLGEIFAPE